MFDPHFDRFNKDDASDIDIGDIEGLNVRSSLFKVIIFAVQNYKFVLILFLIILGAIAVLIGKLFNITPRYDDASDSVNDTLSSKFAQSNSSLVEDQKLLDDHTLYIDLSGAVKHPGLYELSLGSRLSDLIALGGGFTSEASENWVNRNLNLASLLHDEQKIYIPFESDIEYKDGVAHLSFVLEDNNLLGSLVDKESSASMLNDIGNNSKNVSTSSLATDTDDDEDSNSSSGVSSNTSSQVNVNNATLEDLKTLDGIGEAYASRIIANRPYSGLEELKSKSNVPISAITKNEQQIIF